VVTLFTSVLISGPGASFFLLLEGGAGLFLGLTMKHRMGHLLILFLGVTSGTLAFYMLIILFGLLTGFSLSELIISVRASFDGLVATLGLIASIIGLGTWWHQGALPAINSSAALIFTYWWLSFYLLNWILLIPVVIVVYYITNLFIRLLGYQVKPFPGGKIEDVFYWILRRLTKLIPTKGIGKHWIAKTLNREVRRLGIARQKSKT
ncbi:MAG TPA: hypothetical protein VF844_04555, partial [Ktedonobacteraceae bacterium]